ncbi:MAG: hypothetical protein ACIAQF_10820 [Phycisphaerales bacterium JB065]
MPAMTSTHPALATLAATLGWLCLAPLAPVRAHTLADAPSLWPSPLTQPAPPPLRLLAEPVWNQGQPALLIRTDDDRLGGFLLLTLEDLIGTTRLTLLTQSTATGISASSSVQTAVAACGEAAGAWALAATRLAFDATARQTRTSQDHLIRADEDPLDDFSLTVIEDETARRNRLLLFAAAQQEWENPYEHLLPTAFTKTITVMSVAYPSPGPAALALIAGGCALHRRRR